MDLPKVRLIRITGDPGAMLHRCSRVRVTDDTMPNQQVDPRTGHLAEPMLVINAHGNDPSVLLIHQATLSPPVSANIQ